MNNKFNLAVLLTISAVLFPSGFDLFASEINQSKSKIELIEEDLEKSRSDVLFSRQYSLDKDLTSEEINVVIRPYKLSAEQSPDWWSEKQAYDMSFLLVKALNNYPGINASLEKTWEERILEKENLLIYKKNYDIKKGIFITPFVEDFKFQVLTPKKRGIGLVVISLSSKTCINETFLSTRYEFDSYIDIGDIESKQLLVKKKSGSSLNANLFFVGAGGGKFKAPEKPVKEVVYNSIVDSAEGLYCALTNNGECINYYQEREYQFPTVEKKRKKKKKDKSC
jgi:hypothetical protein